MALLIAYGLAPASPSGRADTLTLCMVLGELEKSGAEVLYSSELVPPDLTVRQPLRATDPVARAVEALDQQGLMLRKIGNDRFLVVRVSVPTPASGPGPIPALIAPPPTQLETISVFASRNTFATAVPGEAVAIAGSDIAQSPGSSADALRGLRMTPGLASNISSQPYVRGAQLNDVLVQFDGVPLTDPFHFRKFQSLISALDPYSIDHMNVYTGGFPVEMGTRSAGVIDLAPRTVSTGSEYQISASRESAELSTVGHATGLPVDWLFTIRHSTDGAYLQPVDATFGTPVFYDLIGRLRWQSSDRSALTLGWLALDDQAHVGGEPSEERSRAEFRGLNAWLAWDWTPSGVIHGRTSIAMSSEHQERSGTLNLPGIASGQLSDQRTGSEVTLRSKWVWLASSAVNINAGAETGWQDSRLAFMRSEEFSGAIAKAFSLPAAVTLLSTPNPALITQSAYASVHWRLPGIEAEAGERIDRQLYRGYGARAQGSPRLNARVDATDRLHLYGSWGEFAQAQRPDEWRAEENQGPPDPATRATHLIGGIACNPTDIQQWRIEAYRNHWTSLSPYFDNYLNSLSLVPELEPDRVRIAPTDAETAGVELSTRRTLGEGLDTWSTYAVSRTTDDVHGVDIPRSWDQTHAASVGLSWRHGEGSASVVLGWHSGWPATPASLLQATATTVPGFALGARNSLRWGDYFTADVRIGRAFSFATGDLSLWIDATNITNRSNACCTQFGSSDPPQPQLLLQTVYWRPRELNLGFAWRVRRD